MVRIGHSGLESALSKLPQEVKSHQEDEDIPGQIIEPVELIQPDKRSRCDQNNEDSERAILHGVNLLQSIYFKMEARWLNASRFLLTLDAREQLNTQSLASSRTYSGGAYFVCASSSTDALIIRTYRSSPIRPRRAALLLI